MPSHLTRVVFRRLIANEPLLYRGCRYQVTRPRLINQHRARALPQIQRRTFLDLFKQRRKLKPPEIPPGLETLGDLFFARRKNTKPPKPEIIADALKAFLTQKKGSFEEFDINRAYVGLEYLLENPRDDGFPWFTPEELDKNMFRRLVDPAKRPEGGRSEHLKFGRLLLQEIERPQTEGKDVAGGKPQIPRSSEQENFQNLITLLSIFGAAQEARDLVASKFTYNPDETPAQRAAWTKAWDKVFAGIAAEGNKAEMSNTIATFQDLNFALTPTIQEHIVKFFAASNDLTNAKLWYSQAVRSKFSQREDEPSPETAAALLKACAWSGDHAFGQQVVTSLLKGDAPGKGSWDAILLWSAAIGKGVDEIARMMNVMVRRNDEARQKNPAVEVIRPDIDTINTLVEYAISREDPYAAERYIALGEKRSIIPNEKTYAMQIEYRLSVRDLDGARAAYLNLQGDFTGAEHSVAVINRLIKAMCDARQHHFDELMVMVDDLHERKARFAPETVAALCILHLQRGETHDAKDLLQLHAYQFSPDQRRVIQKALLSFITDGETSTADAWDTYQILRNVFADTPREDRVTAMNNFFDRKRPDMACHVFFHLRNHVSERFAANREVYVAAFTGFARCEDAESLELAHNQLKLDFKIEPNTQLRNSLMLAYASTKENSKALRFWREICESREGPTYNSIAIAFRACEGMNFGHEHAKSIWTRLKEQDIEIDKKIWVAYMCATARNHQHDEALALIETVEEEYGFVPDLEILGNWFNMTASSERQTHVEAWIRERYPQVWDELEALGHWRTMDGFGYRQFNINRDLDP